MKITFNKKILIVKGSSFDPKWIKILKKNFNKNLSFIDEKKFNLNFKNKDNIYGIIGLPRNKFDSNKLKLFKNLEWLHFNGAGIESYMDPWLLNSKIIITNGKIAQGPSVSDHALALILYFSRNIFLSRNSKIQKYRGIGSKIRPIELRKKRVIIFGCGGIGNNICEKLKSFGCYVIGVSDNYTSMIHTYDEFHLYEDSHKLFKSADITICAAPLTKFSKHFFNYKLFKSMKKDSIFINISRGAIVKTNDLLKNDILKKFRGIGLDVTDPEPLKMKNKLSKKPNILITPHIAGPSDHNRERSYELIFRNIKRYLKSLPLINKVDKEREY